ncbi:hypothetical protein HAX54_042680, partial [Datura stramonium]|nr:hypothetical protein [Datura stramonium]
MANGEDEAQKALWEREKMKKMEVFGMWKKLKRFAGQGSVSIMDQSKFYCNLVLVAYTVPTIRQEDTKELQ